MMLQSSVSQKVSKVDARATYAHVVAYVQRSGLSIQQKDSTESKQQTDGPECAPAKVLIEPDTDKQQYCSNAGLTR